MYKINKKRQNILNSGLYKFIVHIGFHSLEYMRITYYYVSPTQITNN